MAELTSIRAFIAAEQKRFDNGSRLRDHFAGAFPLTLKLSYPHSRALRESYAECIAWAQAWYNHCPDRLILKEIRTSMHSQQIPVALRFDTIEELADFISRRRALAQYFACHTQCAQKLPQLLPFIEQHPKFVFDYSSKFAGLLEICVWMLAHPRPNIYLRELDLPGIDTKFLDKNAGVPAAAGRLLDELLDPVYINDQVRAAENFAGRYGFKLKPVFIRCRLLDRSLPGNGIFNQFLDLQFDRESFAKLRFAVDNVVICENEVSYLALPKFARTLAIFGQGYGFAHFSYFSCLKGRRILYWGDLDTDGFRILNELRAELPGEDLRSVLMDEKSIAAFARLGVRDPNAASAPEQLSFLTESEQAAYRCLKENRCGVELRIEQERLPFSKVCAALRAQLRP